MITLKDWMEAVSYRITEGSEYCWNSYGSNVYMLDSWDGEHDGVSSSITFSTKTQEVFEVNVCDYSRDRAYRYINPAYTTAHADEARQKNVDLNVAWDDVNYIDLESVEDMIEKLTAIMNYQDYDTRVSIPLDLPKDELFVLMRMAHERDVTFNQLIEEIIQAEIDRLQPEE